MQGTPGVDLSTAESLQRYGAWGLVVVLAGCVVYLFRVLSAERDEHKREMMAFMDRLIVTTTAQVKEFTTLSQSVVTTIESLSRRIDGLPRSGPENGNGRRA